MIRDFPRVTPHGCVNNSQSFLPDVWTIICVNNPDFNDIGREVFNNGAWEAWLTNHIVKAMLNYPGAVLLGETRKSHTTYLQGVPKKMGSLFNGL